MTRPKAAINYISFPNDNSVDYFTYQFPQYNFRVTIADSIFKSLSHL